MTTPSVALLWFRRDLRIADNPALNAAVAAHHSVVPIYIHDSRDDAEQAPGAASRWWLHHALHALDGELRRLGSRLQVFRGPAPDTLKALAHATGARRVCWNRLYEPQERQIDGKVAHVLSAAGIEVSDHPGALLAEPGDLCTTAGDPFRVFTPFWKAHRRRVNPPRPLEPPTGLAPPPPIEGRCTIDDLALLPDIPWYRGLESDWVPGERGAHLALDRFCRDAVQAYGEDRDRPDRAGTSRLSPHLHFGEISPGQVTLAVQTAAGGDSGAAEPYLRQLGWRDFAHHLLHHFPATVSAPFNPRFAEFPWRKRPGKDLVSWQQGRTGIPLVDAGMRELWQTGWMHNRVRMVVASFLTKNLLIHWREGERWFRDTLVDADLANNVMGWQWVAGSGADAAPYFRIFNPVTQGRRFDPRGAYVRRWVPEIAGLPDKYIHCPWETPADVLKAAEITLGRDYPRPMVDLMATRERALAAYREI